MGGECIEEATAEASHTYKQCSIWTKMQHGRIVWRSIQGLSLNYLDPRVLQAVYNHYKTQCGGMRGTQEQYV